MILQNLGDPRPAGRRLAAGTVPRRRGADRPIVPLEGLLVLLVVAWVVNLAARPGDPRADPEHASRGAVKTGVLSLVWLDVGVVAAVRGPGLALAVAALWVPASCWGWLYST